MRAELHLTNLDQPQSVFRIDEAGSQVLGRRSQNEITIKHKSVSREHCRIDFDGELFWIVDRDSHNGTFVNDKPVRRCMLYDGDRVRCGKVEMVFRAFSK